MFDYLKNLSIPGRLGVVAFALGFLALFAGSPYRGAGAVIPTKELAIAMATGNDQVDVRTLADWIIQEKSNFRVIDLRPAAAYNAYHIPPAENIPVAELTQSTLQHNEKIVLYAEDGARAAQAWTLLRAKGYKGAYLLKGGLDAWTSEILFPRIADNATPAQQVEFARVREVSKYFGGTPQAAGDSSAIKTAVVMPKLTMPAQTSAAAAPKKKKKEGC